MPKRPNNCVDCGALCSPYALRCQSCASREQMNRGDKKQRLTQGRLRSALWREKVTNGRRGPSNPGWRGGTTKDGNGYVLLYLPEHPQARRGYVKRSRLVAEALLGRLLTSDDHVHHINKNITDDRPENLRVLSLGEHLREHQPERSAIAAQQRSWENHGGRCAECGTTEHPHGGKNLCHRCLCRLYARAKRAEQKSAGAQIG
jgi:hypothetical protein